MATHKWHLIATNEARDNLDELSSRDLMGVFHSLKQLLEADNPTGMHGVKKLAEKRFEGQWRQRSGNWRIFFTIQHGEVTHQKHTYKGTLTILAVRRRDEAY